MKLKYILGNMKLLLIKLSTTFTPWLATKSVLQIDRWLVIVSLIITLYSCQSDTLTGTSSLGDQAALPEIVDFNFHIKPILSDRCYKCHGPDENARKADLRFDIEGHAFAMLDSIEETFAIVPGDLEESQLVRRISSTDPDFQMPPPESKLSLSKREVELLKRWIDQGAEWKPHWAFISPTEKKLPTIYDPDWPQNPIDYFILNRLDREGLKPSPKATKEKLIRRLSFDLRGIPPSLQEIDAFLEDSAPDAYERVVDYYLAEEAYGERMTLEWLDLARYADTHGYQDDLERSQWPWRDWVIRSFNENMPYDQFIKWQLAGDLFPDATYEQKLATGFNRNHKITQEVGVVDEEYRVAYVLDRVNTFSTSFLGLTVGCAQCHDHKFDPISQKEFYSLFSFFNNVPEKGRVEYGVEVAEPSMPLPDSTIERYTNYIKELVTSQEQLISSYERSKWENNPELRDFPFETSNETTKIPAGLVTHYSLDYVENNEVEEELRGIRKAKVVNGLVPIPGKYSGALEFSGDNHIDLGPVRALDFSKPLTISLWLYSIENGAHGNLLGPKQIKKGGKAKFSLEVLNDGIMFNINSPIASAGKSSQKAKSLAVQTSNILPGNKWVNISLNYDGSGRASGVKLFMDGKAQELVVTEDDLYKAPSIPNAILLGSYPFTDDIDSSPEGLMRTRVDELMIFNRSLTIDEIQRLTKYNPLLGLTLKSERSDHDNKRLFYHQLHHKDRGYQLLTKRLSEYRFRELRMSTVVLNPTMIMIDMDTVRPTYVLERGQYSTPGELVTQGTPQKVLPFADAYPKNRMGLAMWLFDNQNPLTARVAVNRYWQIIFGRGIVATPEDFGSQGDLPSHPELLDWLALEFQGSGWNVKHLIKTMVTSATYKQSVNVEPELYVKDPDNVLLARGSQIRLQAELVRDHALTISGLLSNQLGGPSVKPYQPKGLWLQVASGNQPLKEYIQDHGEDLYRKSMYTFWKRSLPPPSMMTFDASTREQCEVRRQSTSTPMQALVLLNDPQFTEASRLIAYRMLSEGGADTEERIRFAFRLATSRHPGEKEIALLVNLLKDQQEVFTREPKKAESLLNIGEYQLEPNFDLTALAAYTVVANAILNLTESISKG